MRSLKSTVCCSFMFIPYFLFVIYFEIWSYLPIFSCHFKQIGMTVFMTTIIHIIEVSKTILTFVESKFQCFFCNLRKRSNSTLDIPQITVTLRNCYLLNSTDYEK